MSIEIRIPKLGMAMTEGVLAGWHVSDGGQVNEGDPLYSLENDKATEEVGSPASGILRITGEPGVTYPVGEIIGQIEPME
jgi:pyruvate/2-oxoglutarate dehydrogenase complex dihydrolipoamide acyltransferase (E2) component